MSTPKLSRVLETALYVDDLVRAAAFYEGVMSLAPLLETPSLRAYDVGAASVLLLFKRGGSTKTQTFSGGTIPPHDGSGPIHMAFGVASDELAAWEERLGACEIKIEGRMDWPPGGRSIYFRDPDGHLLELATPGTWCIY